MCVLNDDNGIIPNQIRLGKEKTLKKIKWKCFLTDIVVLLMEPLSIESTEA